MMKLLLRLVCVAAIAALDPLTQIAPDSEELAVFPATLRAALVRAGVPPRSGLVVHIVGATRVEDAVDWSALCQDGLTLVLAGPQVEPLAKMVKGEAIVPREKGPEQACVLVVRGLYSVGVVREALGESHPAATPDLAIAFNADVYMDYWRRTLAGMLQMRTPVVVTVYCEYERDELSKVLTDTSAFSVDAIEAGDAYIRKRYRGDADDFLDLTPLAAPLPAARTLWTFEPNPQAHRDPIDCLEKPYRHGVRNAFWVAFSGAAATANGAPGHEEL